MAPWLEVATAKARNGVWVCALLPRPAALPITFEPWKPRALANFERKERRRVGAVDAALVDDDRLGRTWLAWIGPDADPTRALDADPLVWSVVRAMTPTLVTAMPPADDLAEGGSDGVAPAQGFELGPDTDVHFRGRFVLIGPGATVNLSGRSRPEDIERAVAFVVASFVAHQPPA